MDHGKVVGARANRASRKSASHTGLSKQEPQNHPVEDFAAQSRIMRG
jgi:hypothetical protein